MNEPRKFEVNERSISFSLSVVIFCVSAAVAAANIAFRLSAIEQAEREDRRQLHEVTLEQQRRAKNVYIIDSIRLDLVKMEQRLSALESARRKVHK